LPEDPSTFRIRQISPTDKINKFKVEKSQDGLRAFLKKDALTFHTTNIARTYVAVEETGTRTDIRSFITISLSEIRKEFAELDVPGMDRYSHWPAVKIARLATHIEYEGRGLASNLIELVTGIVTEQIMPVAGCRFLMLDANPQKIEFYKHRGFAIINIPENVDSGNPVMFMDLGKLRN
jgi:hypothetical protein